MFGQEREGVAPVSGEGGVVKNILVGVQAVPVFGVEGEVEVAGNEDAGIGVLGKMVFNGVKEGDGIVSVEVGAEVDVDYEEFMISAGKLEGVKPAGDDGGVGGFGEAFGGEGVASDDGTAAGVGLVVVARGKERMGGEGVLEESEGFVAVVVGLLEEENVGVCEELAEVFEFAAELGRVNGGEGPGVPGGDGDGAVVGVDATVDVKVGIRVGEEGYGVIKVE